MTRAKRFTVARCDEYGTLTDAWGESIHHTWSVVDRHNLDSDGNPREVSNHDTRAIARREADKRNSEGE